MSDAEVVERFERGDVEQFHHADHVRVAFAYLRTMPVLDAIGRFTAALRRFATAQGKPQLYHETITWAFLLIIHERMVTSGQRTDDGRQSPCPPSSVLCPLTWDSFIAANPDLLRWKPSVLESYYRAEVLQSDLARRIFVLPC